MTHIFKYQPKIWFVSAFEKLIKSLIKNNRKLLEFDFLILKISLFLLKKFYNFLLPKIDDLTKKLKHHKLNSVYRPERKVLKMCIRYRFMCEFLMYKMKQQLCSKNIVYQI